MPTRPLRPERGLPRLRTLFLPAMLALGSMALPTRAVDAPPAHPAALAGDEHVLWMVASDWDQAEDEHLNWLVWMDASSLAQNAMQLPAQTGEIRAAAAVDGALHLFFLNAQTDTIKTAHYAYSPGGKARRQLRLPSDALPIALAGDRSLLWALVDGGTTQKIATAWQEYQQSTQPARDDEYVREKQGGQHEAALSSRPEDLPKDRCFFVQFDGRNWKPGFDAPADLPLDAQAWVIMDGPRQHLFWCGPPGSADVRYARRENERWQNGPTLSFSHRVAAGYAGVLNKQLVFAAMLAADGGTELRCEPRVLAPGADNWSTRPALQSADKKPLVLPKGSLVGGIGDNLVLLKASAQGVAVGLWSPADGMPFKDFADVPIRKLPSELDPSDHSGEMIPVIVVMVIVTLIYWVRRDSMNMPMLGAPGPAPISLDQRALAALIDLAPSLILVLVIWWKPVSGFYVEVRAAEANHQAWPPMGPILLPWYVCIGLHAAYCSVFEILWSATPGKRLMRCAVISEQMDRPTALQIIVRNALRIVELDPHLKVWPFMLVLFMTRNRQRLGDLLARTIVVKPGAPIEDSDDWQPSEHREATSSQKESSRD